MRIEPAFNKVDLAISSIPDEPKLESSVVNYIRDRFHVAILEAETIDEVNRLVSLFKLITEK